MAELRDSLNKTVLIVNINKNDAESLRADILLVFQENEFIDNDVGWKIKAHGEVRW